MLSMSEVASSVTCLLAFNHLAGCEIFLITSKDAKICVPCIDFYIFGELPDIIIPPPYWRDDGFAVRNTCCCSFRGLEFGFLHLPWWLTASHNNSSRRSSVLVFSDTDIKKENQIFKSFFLLVYILHVLVCHSIYEK